MFGGKDDETNNANKDAANYRERSVEQIYAEGWRAIERYNTVDVPGQPDAAVLGGEPGDLVGVGLGQPHRAV